MSHLPKAADLSNIFYANLNFKKDMIHSSNFKSSMNGPCHYV
mgnify:CR=1 FL=1